VCFNFQDFLDVNIPNNCLKIQETMKLMFYVNSTKEAPTFFFCWTLFSTFGRQFHWNGKDTSSSSQVDKKISILLPLQPKGEVAQEVNKKTHY
jgi:hypothetical protein